MLPPGFRMCSNSFDFFDTDLKRPVLTSHMEEMTILFGGTICLAYTLWELMQLAIKAQDQVCLARQGARQV